MNEIKFINFIKKKYVASHHSYIYNLFILVNSFIYIHTIIIFKFFSLLAHFCSLNSGRNRMHYRHYLKSERERECVACDETRASM